MVGTNAEKEPKIREHFRPVGVWSVVVALGVGFGVWAFCLPGPWWCSLCLLWFGFRNHSTEPGGLWTGSHFWEDLTLPNMFLLLSHTLFYS